ncbi:MAG: hypothetical protein QM676_13425 [Novosphingobium sp.]
MNSKTLFLATALAILPAGTVLAQEAATPASAAEQPAPNASPAAPAEATAPAETAAPAASAPTVAATQADLKAGATVFDAAGVAVGTIQSVTATGAVVAAGKLRAEVPTASFAKNDKGLVIGITKAEFEAAVNRAKS